MVSQHLLLVYMVSAFTRHDKVLTSSRHVLPDMGYTIIVSMSNFNYVAIKFYPGFLWKTSQSICNFCCACAAELKKYICNAFIIFVNIGIDW